MSWTVFYAWQSDSPGNTNRNLIQRALEEAIEQVRADGTLDVDPRLDKDTLGIPGAPDIVATIFEKISRAAVFVADVTLVTPPDSILPAPNPNVLIELGFALKALGPQRVVIVMNTAYGEAELLPFDIRQKRALTYNLTPDAPEKAPERKRLQATLGDAIRLGLEAADADAPRPPPKPTMADSLVSAIEQRSPTQRRAARNLFEELLREIDARKPDDPSSDDSLVDALERTVDVVAGFLSVAEVIAVYRPAEVVEETLRGFEQILLRYDIRAGSAGSFSESDFDYFKFLGHELFVLLVAAFMREEAWEALNDVLSPPLHVGGAMREESNVTYEALSEYIALLDRVRQQKLRTSTTIPISVHANVLRDRYSSGELASRVGWDWFRAADFFLFLRSRMDPTKGDFSFWRPWSVLYLKQLPPFIERAETRAYAERVARGLGLSDVGQLAPNAKLALEFIRRFYHSATWLPPGRGFDWSRIASR